MHVPAVRREASAFWKLHNIYGYGFRKWRVREQCFDPRIAKVASRAAACIKSIMREDARTGIQMPTEAVAVRPFSSPQAPPRRCLRAQTSDVSTCAPSSVAGAEELEQTDEEKEEEPAQGKRSHPRRPRVGRRAKARVRREEWEMAKQSGSLGFGSDTNTTMLLETLLDTINEDDEQWNWRTQAWEEISVGTKSDDTGEDQQEPSKQDFIVEPPRVQPVEQDPVHQGQSSEKVVHGPQLPMVEMDIQECKGDQSSCEDEDLSSDSSEGGPADDDLQGLIQHELLDGPEREVCLLPARCMWAMVRLQEAVREWQAFDHPPDPWEVLQYGTRELLPRLRRVQKAVRQAGTSWSCPHFMANQWADVQEWLLNGDLSPGYQQNKFEELVEDLEDKRERAQLQGWQPEVVDDWLRDELVFRRQSMEDGWDEFLDLVGAVGLAQRRHEWRSASLESALNSRLTASLKRETR